MKPPPGNGGRKGNRKIPRACGDAAFFHEECIDLLATPRARTTTAMNPPRIDLTRTGQHLGMAAIETHRLAPPALTCKSVYTRAKRLSTSFLQNETPVDSNYPHISPL